MYLFPNAINIPSDYSWGKKNHQKINLKKTKQAKTTTTSILQKLQFHSRWSQNPLNYLSFFIHSTLFPEHKCQIAGAYKILLL